MNAEKLSPEEVADLQQQRERLATQMDQAGETTRDAQILRGLDDRLNGTDSSQKDKTSVENDDGTAK